MRAKLRCAERDRLVLEAFATRGIPVAVVMTGGYANDMDDAVMIHRHTVREGAEVWCGLRGLTAMVR